MIEAFDLDISALGYLTEGHRRGWETLGTGRGTRSDEIRQHTTDATALDLAHHINTEVAADV